MYQARPVQLQQGRPSSASLATTGSMTIHSDWSRILHSECPQAFIDKGKLPKGPHSVGIIDGHLQLMRLHGALPSWDAFVQYLYVRPIARLFEAGCPTVVLCFDSYDSVPVYKSMVQGSRAAKHVVQVFRKDQQLPERIPADAMLYMMNRHFKLRVIDLVCSKLPGAVQLQAGQRLVVDYRRAVAYDHGVSAPVLLDRQLQPMGESDVKFCRYVSLYGNALVHAIDGDYLAIALLYYTMHGLRQDNRIFIYRHLSTLADKAKNNAKKGRGAPPWSGNGAVVVAGGGRKKRGKPVKKTDAESKCWVDVQMLYAALVPRVRGSGFSDAERVASAVFLMLSAGTDFSRGLPMVGPKRLWDQLPAIGPYLLRAVVSSSSSGSSRRVITGACDNNNNRRGEDDTDNYVDEDLYANDVVARLYTCVYKRHLNSSSCSGSSSLESVLSQLQGSSLSQTTKDRLPSVEQIAVTVRNLKWVVRYWRMHNGSVETPLDGRNGFCVAEDGSIRFADATNIPTTNAAALAGGDCDYDDDA